MMRSSLHYSIIVLSIILFNSLAKSENIIGLNFSETAATELSGKTADGFSNWADGGLTGNDVILPGSNDLVSCSWSANNFYQDGDVTTADEQLYYSYLDDPVDGPRIAIEGLSDWMASEGFPAYTIRIYQNTDYSDAAFAPVYVYQDGMTLRQDEDDDGIVNSYLGMAIADNVWYGNGGSRAYVDILNISSDIITIDTGWRNLGARVRSTVAAIKITGVDPYVPISPDPEVGVEVAVDYNVSWEQYPDISGKGVVYDVYIGEEPNELHPEYYGLSPVKTTTDDMSDFFYGSAVDFKSGSTYYWRIDALVPDSQNPGFYIVHKGYEWWFTTEPESARINAAPESQTVAAGANVELSVDTLNATIFKWFKNGLLLENDSTDTLYIGEEGPVLTIFDAQISDEGNYYCEVDNSLNIPVVSSSAQLMVERQVSWWKFENDLTDSINELYPNVLSHDAATAKADPNFVSDGIDSYAYELYGNANEYITVPGSADYFNFYSRGYSISVWIKESVKTGTNWETYISKQADGEGFGVFNQKDGAPVFVQRNSFGDLYSNTEIDNNQWHLVTVTYDNTLKEGRVYVDGVLRNTSVALTVPRVNSADLVIGAEYENSTRNLLSGKIDDFRIWNYPLDAYEIGNVYTDFVPDAEICVEYPMYDIAGPGGVGEEYRDCKVDLYDLVPVAQMWLQCNLLPSCAQ